MKKAVKVIVGIVAVAAVVSLVAFQAFLRSDSMLVLHNGLDADSAPGPVLVVGSMATFDYQVTNIGIGPITNVVLVDDGTLYPPQHCSACHR